MTFEISCDVQLVDSELDGSCLIIRGLTIEISCDVLAASELDVSSLRMGLLAPTLTNLPSSTSCLNVLSEKETCFLKSQVHTGTPKYNVGR